MKIYEVDLCCTRSHFPMSVQLEDTNQQAIYF